MKKGFFSILLFFVALSVGASNNYTIAIVPYISNVNNFEVSSSNQVYEQTNKMDEMEVPGIILKATNEVASIFNKYILSYIELNKQQKMNFLMKMQNQIINVSKDKLADYYVDIANNNYQSIDLDEYDLKIETLKKEIQSQQDGLDNLIKKNSDSNDFINTLDLKVPTNSIDEEVSTGDIEIKVIDDYKDCFLLSNYPNEYRGYFLNKNNVDEIVFVEVDKISNLNNLKIYQEIPSQVQKMEEDGSYQNALDLIFDEIIVNDSLSDLDASILQALVDSFIPQLTIVKNKIPNVNISIKQIISQDVLNKIKIIEDDAATPTTNNGVIYIDANLIGTLDTVDLTNSTTYILLEPGIHYFLISGTNINSYVLKVVSESNKIATISTEGNPKRNGKLQLSSDIGKVNWVIDGKDLGFTNSLEIDNQVVPSTILLKKLNFSDKIIELNEISTNLDLSLNPQWMGQESVFEKKQSDFYQGLLNYIIGCATFISVKTINNIYGADDLKVVINNLNNGALILAQVNIVYQLVSYIKLATN